MTTGGCYNPLVAAQIVDVANFNNKVTIEEADTYGNETGRGDCIALLDVNEDDIKIVNAKSQAEILSAFGEVAGQLPASKYAAIFAPSLDRKSVV